MRLDRLKIHKCHFKYITYGTTYDINDGHIVAVNDEKEQLVKRRMKRIRRTRFKARLRRGTKKVLTAPIRLINGFSKPQEVLFEFDGGVIPICPNCKTYAHNQKRCSYCGQRFLQTEEWVDYCKPKTEQGKCLICGADVTIRISKYNGHKSYECEKCGCKVME